ncbi:hypothetical protein TNCV_4248791 [Trichonephila clavipes]|nr:hypothetical protein TNCV_4248791 [Trichonephila clavipes]
MWSDHGILVVMATNLYAAYHELEPSAIEDPPGCKLNLSRLQSYLGSVEVWRGLCHLRGRPHYLTIVQNYEIRCQ